MSVKIPAMSKRIMATIARDIRTAEANLSLVKSDYEFTKKAYKGFPSLIKQCSELIRTLKEEERQYSKASLRERRSWRAAGDVNAEIEPLGTSKIMCLAADKA
jgi:hypothetical protein